MIQGPLGLQTSGDLACRRKHKRDYIVTHLCERTRPYLRHKRITGLDWCEFDWLYKVAGRHKDDRRCLYKSNPERLLVKKNLEIPAESEDHRREQGRPSKKKDKLESRSKRQYEPGLENHEAQPATNNRETSAKNKYQSAQGPQEGLCRGQTSAVFQQRLF